MKRPSWAWMGLLAAVASVHLLLLAWWQRAPDVNGTGTWQASRQPVKVRTTVLSSEPQNKVMPALVPLRESNEETPQVSMPTPLAEAIPKPNQAGAVKPWSPSPAHYLSIEQVDVYPHPAEDWVLDLSKTPPGQAWQLRLLLWVSASGQIDHVDVLDATPNGPWVEQVLAPLKQTEMKPGMLAGQPVAVTYPVQMAPDQLQ